MYKGLLLNPEEVLENWILIKPYIESFLEQNGESTAFTICRDAMDGLCQVWIFLDTEDELVGVSVTKIDDYPTTKAFHIIGLSGVDWDTWSHLLRECFYPYAEAADCDEITLWGRRGWLRKLKDYTGLNGEYFEEKHVIMSMQIKGD